jgi:hypothetical protein
MAGAANSLPGVASERASARAPTNPRLSARAASLTLAANKAKKANPTRPLIKRHTPILAARTAQLEGHRSLPGRRIALDSRPIAIMSEPKFRSLRPTSMIHQAKS